MFCSKCGSGIQNDQNFCPKCGSSIKGSQESASKIAHPETVSSGKKSNTIVSVVAIVAVSIIIVSLVVIFSKPSKQEGMFISNQSSEKNLITKLSDKLSDEMLRSKQKRSLIEVRTISYAIHSYAMDHAMEYPNTNGKIVPVSSIRSLLTPDYLQKFPDTDGWGVFPYYYGSNGKSFLVYSLGLGGQPDDDLGDLTRQILVDRYYPRINGDTSCFENDIIYCEGFSDASNGVLKAPSGEQKKCY